MFVKKIEFKGSLDEFLDSLDNLEGMEAEKCLWNLQITKYGLFQDRPIVKLYRGNELVGSTSYEFGKEDSKEFLRTISCGAMGAMRGSEIEDWVLKNGKIKRIGGATYTFLAGLKEYDEPLSVYDLAERKGWPQLISEVAHKIEHGMECLERIGIVKKTGQDRYLGIAHCNKFELATTNGFRILYTYFKSGEIKW